MRTSSLGVLCALLAAGEAHADPHRGRTVVELGVMLALGTGWYEWQVELNKRDFDFARTPGEQWRRLGTTAGYRFDDNERYLNIGHAFAGAVYYGVARANGGSLLESFLTTAVVSTIWEVAVEHREVISVNDQIVTIVGEVPLGEACYQLGRRLLAHGHAPGSLSLSVGGGHGEEGWYQAARLDLDVRPLSELSLEVAGRGQALDRFTLDARASVRAPLATGLTLAYADHGDVTDFMLVVHAIGPAFDLAAGGFRLSGELTGDFSMVRPFAVPADADVTGGKSTLAQGYYYGWGGGGPAPGRARDDPGVAARDRLAGGPRGRAGAAPRHVEGPLPQ